MNSNSAIVCYVVSVAALLPLLLPRLVLGGEVTLKTNKNNFHVDVSDIGDIVVNGRGIQDISNGLEQSANDFAIVVDLVRVYSHLYVTILLILAIQEFAVTVSLYLRWLTCMKMKG